MGAIMTTTQTPAIWIMCTQCHTPERAHWSHGNVYSALCPVTGVALDYDRQSALTVGPDDMTFPGRDGAWYSASNEETGQWEAWDYDGAYVYVDSPQGTWAGDTHAAGHVPQMDADGDVIDGDARITHYQVEDTRALCGAHSTEGTIVKRNVTCPRCTVIWESIYYTEAPA